MPTVLVIDIVDLVEDDGIDAIETEQRGCTHGLRLAALLEEQVTENLRGHDNNVGIGDELDIACHNADSIVGEKQLEIVVLLIAQRLDRCRIEDATAALETLGNLVLSHERLA